MMLCKSIMTDKELLSGVTVITDVSDGAKRKYWVLKNGKKYLLKVSKVHYNGELTQEHVSEYLTMKIANALDIPCVNILLGGSAILSEVMLNEEVQSFIEYSEEFSHSFHLSNLQTFNVSTLLNPDNNMYVSDVVTMLLFDAFIGNSDRHPGNFGITSHGFYPLFDNGSSLLAYVKEGDLSSYLNDEMRFRSCMYTKSKPVLRDNQKLTHKELVDILRVKHRDVFMSFSNRVMQLDIRTLLSDLPISEERKKLLFKFLSERVLWFGG